MDSIDTNKSNNTARADHLPGLQQAREDGDPNDLKTPKNPKKTLQSSLIRWFLIMALLPLLIIAGLGYQQAHQNLSQSAADNLQVAASAKAQQMKTWFDYRRMDMSSQAENQHNSALLLSLEQGFKSSGETAEQYVRGFGWVSRVDQAQEHLVTVNRRYDYIEDIYLINNEGIILFSVNGGTDLGSNLLKGPLAKTHFADSARFSLQSGHTGFSDLEKYSPANNKLSSFITAPLTDEFGNRIGLIAMQVNLNRIFAATADHSGTRKTRVHYLVGGDGLLRSTLKPQLMGILNADADADILNRKIDTLPILATLNQNNPQKSFSDHPVTSYIGPEGQPVFGTYHRINAFNTQWLLISEIDQLEAMALVDWLTRVTIVVVLMTALLVIWAALYQARRITQPLIALARVSRAASSGETAQPVEVSSNDEIGQLADDFNQMMELRLAHMKVLERAYEETEQALAELAEQKFALDQHALVSVTDLNGTITFVNQKFADVSGYKIGDLIGKNHRMVNSGHHPQSFWANMYATLASGDAWHGDVCNMNKQGSLYWVSSTVVPFRSRNGSIQSYVAIRTEITEQKQVESALHEARANAEGATEAKSEFLANMSHEIRTPMNGVIGMTNLLLDGELTEDQHQRARTIKRSAEALLNIINDILDFSKIEAGKLQLEPIEFDLGELLADLAEAHSAYSDTSEVELICPANPMESQWFIGDPGRIRQILTNLVGNAQKFTSQGEVAVHINAPDPVDGMCKLHFEVTDTGIGLSKSKQEKLFERFSQADATTTREYGGTGLGLSISSQLVEMMDGKIGVCSVENEGSTFWFSINLPIAEHRRKATELIDFSAQRMLVVDDNATNQQLLHELLNSWKINHDKVNNGPRALQALYDGIEKQDPYTVVLLDMHMPGLDGSRLGKQIISEPLFSGAKVLMITAQGRRGDGERMIKEGFAGALSKPINQNTLYGQLLALSGISRITERSEPTQKNRNLPQFNARVLVVEDNSTNQQVAKGMLAKFSVDVDIAADGQEALRTLALLPYDLVFMDCQMPVMDGFQATALIRDQSWHAMDPDIPVVAMTANARPEDHARCLDAGMNDFVSKPIDPTKLGQALERWLPQQCHPDQNLNPAPASPIKIEHPLDQTPDTKSSDQQSKPHRLMVNDDELMRMVTAAFMGDLVDQISYLKELVADNSVQEAVLQAQKIRNAAINVGGIALSILANKLEQQGQSNAVTTISQGMPKLEKNLTLEDDDQLDTQFPTFISDEAHQVGLASSGSPPNAPSSAPNQGQKPEPEQPEKPEKPDSETAIRHANDG